MVISELAGLGQDASLLFFEGWVQVASCLVCLVARHSRVLVDQQGNKMTVGDRVWLYVPAVKQGRTRKLVSLWCGPYTVIN